jgi:methylthioribose-1-phosphate isomerase
VTRTIDWDGEAVVIIDQTLLPHEEKVIRLEDVAALAEAIRSLRVRGAPALGVAGALGIAMAVRRARDEGTDIGTAATEAARELGATRPTAVNLRWGIVAATRPARVGLSQAVAQR